MDIEQHFHLQGFKGKNMITKGIVQEKIDEYTIRVRLPIYDGTEKSQQGTPNSSLSLATICSLPNSSSFVDVGDIVFVAFEDDDMGKPVIIGHLFKEAVTNTKINLELNSLTTHSNTKLYKDTWIGNVNPIEISYLEGVNNPIQTQINYILERIENLENNTTIQNETNNNENLNGNEEENEEQNNGGE